MSALADLIRTALRDQKAYVIEDIAETDRSQVDRFTLVNELGERWVIRTSMVPVGTKFSDKKT